ncbi:Uncharacterised protein [uncultured Eubacterium sp.]|nr:Uncharacterised protein [uncultured Eubacterium sp.]
MSFYLATIGINRYIMECKSVGGGLTKGLTLELIDTLWNVNEIKVKARLTDDKELIDTLWNVNKSLQTIANQAQQRINRYIMECKF